jgi:hypothetical protein
MRQCPECNALFIESNTDEYQRYHDEVVTELLRRQRTSDLCLDCIMEVWAAELGEARLHQRAVAA